MSTTLVVRTARFAHPPQIHFSTSLVGKVAPLFSSGRLLLIAIECEQGPDSHVPVGARMRQLLVLKISDVVSSNMVLPCHLLISTWRPGDPSREKVVKGGRREFKYQALSCGSQSASIKQVMA